jgi:hypothetical protein
VARPQRYHHVLDVFAGFEVVIAVAYDQLAEDTVLFSDRTTLVDPCEIATPPWPRDTHGA